MVALPLKGYLRRNWWIILLMIIVSWAIPRAIVPRPVDVLFFVLFLYLLLDRLQAHENKIHAQYQLYTAAIYKAEKISMDLLKSLEDLQTVGLLVTLRAPLLAELALHVDTIPAPQFQVLKKHFYEIN